MNQSLWFENPREFIRHELRHLMSPAAGWQRGSTWRTTGVFPPVNVYDNGEGYRIRAEMPGVDRESLDVSCKADQVVIRGERSLEDISEEANFHRREREGGTFRRAVSLPQPVDPDRVQAEYNNGILDIFAPRAEEAKPRKVTIK